MDNTTERIFDDIHSWYSSIVDKNCKDFLSEALKYTQGIEGQRLKDRCYDALSGIIDNTCTPTRDNILILAASDNDSIGTHDYDRDFAFTESNDINFRHLAYAALNEDIHDNLSRIGFNWNDIPGTVNKALDWFTE